MRDLWDKPWFSVLTKLTYSAYLNTLWLICSLPIFTIGASTTALFYCTLKMAEDRDEGLTRMFFRAFRSNFKAATKLWLILLALEMCIRDRFDALAVTTHLPRPKPLVKEPFCGVILRVSAVSAGRGSQSVRLSMLATSQLKQTP